MDTQKYILSRKGYQQRGLQSLMEGAKISLSNVEEFGRRALTVNLTEGQVETLEELDDLVSIRIYEGLKIPSRAKMSGFLP